MPTQTQQASLPPQALRRWTRAEYDRMIEVGILTPGDHCELLEGEIVKKMPQNAPHATGVRLASKALQTAYGSSFLIDSQLPLALDARSEPEPDVFVLRGTLRDFADEHPTTALLVVEVSDTSLADDRLRKKRIYARAGIEEYWIVNLEEGCLEVHRAPEGEGYEQEQTLSPPAEVTPPETDAAVSVADLLP